jgi:PAS domain S-box-containing protein
VRRADGVEIQQAFRVSMATGAEGVSVVAVLRSAADGLDGECDPLRQDSELPNAETSYRAVFDAVPVGVLQFDARARITACNDVFVEQMGSSRQVLIGLDMLTVANAEVTRAVREALAGDDGHFEGEYVSATGHRRRSYRALFSPILREGRVEGGVGIIDDITDRREIEARLAQGERMASLGRLAAGVAHEINNPLAYVRTSLDIARREIDRFRRDRDTTRLEKILELIEHADDGIERVRVIANDLKTFSRGDEGSWIAVELERIVETAVNLAWNEIRHRAELVRDIRPVPPVMGSESRYVQVLVNLLVNAAQAIPEGDAQHNRITIRTGRAGHERVFLEGEDTGSGIDAERLEHVFEPFWPSKPKGVGTGLGLSICHGIVTSAGGDIRVTRSVPGEGTTFRIELPAAPYTDDRRGGAGGMAMVGSGTPMRRARILVVDDEPKLGATLRLALGDRFEVEVVDSGRDAEQRIEQDGAFDLVLCDLMMPEVSGMDLYERVCGIRPELAPRFVFMTGGAFTDRAREFLKEHRMRRIEKPFPLERVEELLVETRERERS